MDLDIANRYTIHSKVGSGQFGIVYKAIYNKTGAYVALKTEDLRTSTKLLKHETTILKYLYDHSCRNIPIVHWFGINHNFTCLAMTLYECSLYDYLNNKSLNETQLNACFHQMIHILESIHDQYVIHRDIKPHNFMIKNKEIFLIDFGFATFYIDEHKKHIEEGSQQTIIGSPMYVSFNIHSGSTPSRRDDLISLGYLYIYMYFKELPWDKLNHNTNLELLYDVMHILHYKNQQRMNTKQFNELSPICDRINPFIGNYLSYCYQLKYADLPNYDALKNIFISNDSSTITI